MSFILCVCAGGTQLFCKNVQRWMALPRELSKLFSRFFTKCVCTGDATGANQTSAIMGQEAVHSENSTVARVARPASPPLGPFPASPSCTQHVMQTISILLAPSHHLTISERCTAMLPAHSTGLQMRVAVLCLIRNSGLLLGWAVPQWAGQFCIRQYGFAAAGLHDENLAERLTGGQRHAQHAPRLSFSIRDMCNAVQHPPMDNQMCLGGPQSVEPPLPVGGPYPGHGSP